MALCRAGPLAGEGIWGYGSVYASRIASILYNNSIPTIGFPVPDRRNTLRALPLGPLLGMRWHGVVGSALTSSSQTSPLPLFSSQTPDIFTPLLPDQCTWCCKGGFCVVLCLQHRRGAIPQLLPCPMVQGDVDPSCSTPVPSSASARDCTGAMCCNLNSWKTSPI